LKSLQRSVIKRLQNVLLGSNIFQFYFTLLGRPSTLRLKDIQLSYFLKTLLTFSKIKRNILFISLIVSGWVAEGELDGQVAFQ